jgi:hypothetical protein
VDAKKGVAERVPLPLHGTPSTAAAQEMRPLEAGTTSEEQLEDLELVTASSENDGRHVRRVVGTFVVRLQLVAEGGQGAAVARPLAAQHLTGDRGVVDEHLDYTIDTLVNGLQFRSEMTQLLLLPVFSIQIDGVIYSRQLHLTFRRISQYIEACNKYSKRICNRATCTGNA